MPLSTAQITALRYVKGRSVFAAELNTGDGNRRRTLLSLIKLKMIAWGPVYHQCLVLTDAGKEQLQRALDARRSTHAKLGWSGLCLAGKHGLDYEGQPCDLCAETPKPRTKFLDYDARREPKTDFCCVMCQRDLDRHDPKLRWVHLVEDVLVLHPEDASRYTPDAKDRGAHPIGPECARKLGSEWTHPSEAAARLGATL